MLVHKLPESICVSGPPTTFTRKPRYRSYPGESKSAHTSNLGRSWKLPDGYFWNLNGDLYSARRSNAVMSVHKLPDNIWVGGSHIRYTKKPRVQMLPYDLSRSGSNKAHTRTLVRLWKLPVSYYVNQSGDPDDAWGPTRVWIVQELSNKNVSGESNMQPHDTQGVWSTDDSVEATPNTSLSGSHMELHTIPTRSAVVMTMWKLPKNTCINGSHMIPERFAAVTIERKLPKNTFWMCPMQSPT